MLASHTNAVDAATFLPVRSVPSTTRLTPKLPAVECPVLLIVGDKDPMGPKASSIIASQFPNAELVTVPDCGHWVHVSKPEVVVDAVDRFRNRLT